MTLVREQLHILRSGRAGRQVGALLVGRVFEQVALGDEFVEFLTLPAYEEMLKLEG